jgi:hypothetical protein
VGYQLGHKPGSPMTQRYARFIPEAQKRIVEHSERVLLNVMLADDNRINLKAHRTGKGY